MWFSRVVKSINVTNTQCVLPQTPEPPNVLIFQGKQSENPSYTSGSSTEMPIPREEARTFPVIYDSGNLPIIFNHQSDLVEPYTSTTVQHLFKTQAYIPINPHYEANPCICPYNPSHSGANPALNTMLSMIPTLPYMILLPNLSKLSLQMRI
jgi:hypothetical protein